MHAFWRDHPWRLRAAALVSAALAVAGLQWLAPAAFRATENVAGDVAWRAGARDVPERRIVVVDIDEASLREVGPWPWPRPTIARLSDRLAAAGAAVQVYDIVFDAPRDGDAELAAAWARAPVVGGQIFSLDADTTPAIGRVAGALAAERCPSFAPAAHGHVANSGSLLGGAPVVGHLTPDVGADGVVRELPALVCHDGRAYPTLAMAALWRAAQPGDRVAAGGDWSVAPAELLGWWGPHAWITSPSLPGIAVPVDRDGLLRVPFRVDRRALTSVSAHSVLAGTVDPGLLQGAVALVGATAFGISDVAATPLSAVAGGVEVHAQLMAGLLDHHVPYTPRRAGTAQAVAVVALAVLLLGVATRRWGATVVRLPVAGIVLAVGCYAGAAWALWQADLWLPWAAPALFALLASTALATAEHALTRAQRARLSAHLGSYLPGPVAERLMRTDPSGRLQVDERLVTVLVADIRNFSAFAAHRPAQETAALLHAFYCLAVDVIEQHGGVVENVVGDSVLAVWNAYSPCQDHSQQGLDAAKELLQATRALLSRPLGEPEAAAVQPLALGVGLETGQAIVGSFGPARRRAHVALGEPVSVASRLQQMTLDLSMPILVGPQLAARVSADSCEPLGEYLLEGMSRQYTVFACADWAELAPTDQIWTNSASSRPPRSDEAERWPESSSLRHALIPGVPHPLRDA